MTVRAWTVRGIERYRRSAFHDRNAAAACCRFSPSCSHYAEDALRLRSLPVALLLIAWRIVRCNRFTRAGTYDPVTPRDPRWVKRAFGVLGLAALTTVFVAGTASAMTTATLPRQSGFGPTAGGCSASVGGQPINVLTAEKPLHVHTRQGVVLTGRGPANVANLQTVELRSVTDIKVHFVEKLATRSETHTAEGQNFQRAVNVDTYLRYGSGLYRVDVHSVAVPGWDCAATFYVELHGSKLAAEVAVAVGGIGAVGVALSAGDNPPPEDTVPPRADEQGMYDPAIAPDELEKARARKAKAANAKATSTVGCLAAILFALIASTGAFAMTAPVPEKRAEGSPRIVWVRGRPVLGFVSGLFLGLGVTVALQQLNVYPLTLTSAVIAPLVTAVLGGWRGWRGCAWQVG